MAAFRACGAGRHADTNGHAMDVGLQVEERMANLEKQFKETTDKKVELEASVDLCAKKLVRAQQLIGGLGGEKVRWGESLEQLKQDFTRVMGNVIIASAEVSYLGAFTQL